MAHHILIVDDHELLRTGVRSLLSSRPEWGICGEAVDGLDAIEKARALKPSVVLMDISMPRMDGLEAARILRREMPSSKVIIISQNDPIVARRQSLDVGAAAFVCKTTLANDLLPAIESVITENSPAIATPIEAAPPSSLWWLAGGGELASLIREYDWAQTPLGPIERWPQSLKTSVNLILNARHPMWVGWGRDVIFFYNDAYIEVLSSAKHPTALGKPAAEVWSEIWEICGPLANKVFDKGEPSFVDEVRLFMNRGNCLEETYYSFSYSPIRDESGSVVGLFCPSTDVTPKVINARRLRTLSELSANALTQKTTESACESAAATLAANPDDVPFAALYTIDRESNTARLEQARGIARDIAALTPESIDLGHESSLQPLSAFSSVVRQVQTRTVPVTDIEGLPLGPAQQRLTQAVLLPVTFRGDAFPVGVLVAGVNPTRKLDTEYCTFFELAAGQIAAAIQNARAAEEERKQMESLAELDRAKTAFFSNVSHEFRTPLTLMLGPVEELLARSHTDLSPAAKSQLELVNRNGSRLLRLVNTLLDFSRIEAGRMQALYQPTDLAAFTVELASVFRSATEKAGLQLNLDCPPLSEPVFVDRNLWEKIVLNLISNAFKFTFEGSIFVSLSQCDDHVDLRVRDTGVGIPPHELPRLFDRFHRVENARSRTHEGSGIGLALVQELVKLHGGTVRVESLVDQGTTFVVSIPLGSAHLPSERIGGTRTLSSTTLGATPFVEEALRWLPTTAVVDDEPILLDTELIPVPCPPTMDGTESRKRPVVLLADDNADMRQYLSRLLAERYEVLTAADGEAALALLSSSRPDLVLTDVMMPKLDGFGLLQKLRSDPETRTIPVIVLSARAGEEARVEGMQQGADDYLIKPFSARELLARVQTHLEMARVRKESQEALSRRTAQFETLLNEAPMGVYVVDGNLRVREANPRALQVFGDASNVIGGDFAELARAFAADAYVDQIVAHFRHTLETGEPWTVDEHAVRRTNMDVGTVYEWQINRIVLPDGGYGVVCYIRDISRQVQARKAVAESEQRLRLATEAAELGIWQWYPDQDRGFWENDRMYQIYGRSKDEDPITVAEFASEIVHPEDRESFETAYRSAQRDHSRFVFQGRVRHKDGAFRWVELTGQVEHRDDGSPPRMLGTVLDVTERKKGEDALRESEERFRALVNASSDMVYRMNADWTEMLRLEGRGFIADAQRPNNNWIQDYIHPDDRPLVLHTIQTAIHTKGLFELEHRVLKTDGTVGWTFSRAVPLLNAKGEITEWFGAASDITDSKNAEERERQITAEAIAANAKFRALFEQTNVFAGIMTKDGIVMEVNRACLEVCGYRAEEVLGRLFWDTPWWRNFPESQQNIRAATPIAAHGVPYRETLHYSWADGTERLVEFALYPIVDEAGKILFLHPTGIDITDLKRAEENYRQLAETLETEVRARTSELENRNVEVLRQSDLLREFSQRLLQAQDEERRRIARELHDSAGQTLTVLGLNLAQFAQQIGRDAPALTSELKLINDTVQQLHREIRTTSYLLHPPLLDETGLSSALHWYVQGLQERSDLQIDLEMSPDFGRLPREMELVVFRLVQECLTNIHRHAGSKTATIRIERNSQALTVEVRDQGKGMPSRKLAEVQTGGSGVGIRGMHERLRQFKGKLTIQSDSSGTRISATIPLPDPSPVEQEDGNEPLQAAG